MSTDDTPTQRLQRRALAIFDEIAELDPAVREARLQDLCAGEAELLMEVRSLLVADAGATDPFADAPRCPHMGCALQWNPDTRTWDCPCHGSRFTRSGRLLDGPAVRDGCWQP